LSRHAPRRAGELGRDFAIGDAETNDFTQSALRNVFSED
jgi:hypothetical protein